MKFAIYFVALFAITNFVGCAGRPGKVATNAAPAANFSSSADLEVARLVYSPLPALPSRGVELASYEEGQEGLNAEIKREPLQRVLSITYPHPDGEKHKAVAEVVVRNPDFRREERSGPLAAVGGWLDRSLPGVAVADDGSTAYRLTLTKSEVDALLRQLAAKGMLEPQANSTGDSELSLTINGKARELKIGRERTLEELSARVVMEGRVVSTHDESVAELPRDQPQEVAADSFYENLSR